MSSRRQPGRIRGLILSLFEYVSDATMSRLFIEVTEVVLTWEPGSGGGDDEATSKGLYEWGLIGRRKLKERVELITGTPPLTVLWNRAR